jgi:hippurate hydrolase
VVSRNIDPTQTAVVTVGTIHAGQAPNVIPEEARLGLSVRSFDETVRRSLRERIVALVTRHAEGYGATAEIVWEEGYPVVVNTAAETGFAQRVALELVGPDRVVSPFGPVTGSEDFAYYLQQRPGCFLRLGNGVDSPMLHNARYDFADGNLAIGAAYWTRLVEAWLADGVVTDRLPAHASNATPDQRPTTS